MTQLVTVVIEIFQVTYFNRHLRNLPTTVFLKSFIAQKVHTVSTRINYKIVPVTKFSKYLHYGTSGTE